MAPTKISEADALAAHKALHSAAASVKLPSGKTLPVELHSNKCRCVKFDGEVTAMEQNKAKASDWTAKAKKGAKITWFLTGPSPSCWGRIVDGTVEQRGRAIHPVEGSSSSSGTAIVKKRPAAASGGAEAEEAAEPPAKKAKAKLADSPAPKAKAAPAKAAPAEAPAKKAKIAAVLAAPSEASASGGPLPGVAGSSASDPLGLSALFTGSGHGATWEAILRPVIEKQQNAASYIGPGRDKLIVPVRQMTFQALKPNPPSGWRVVSFGQSPYPRMESATGIAHFDNAFTSWADGRFGSVQSMRCIIKTAAMQKYGVPKDTTVDGLRALMKEHGTVGPAEWFAAMLTQGVLLMNAACTLMPPKDKVDRSGSLVREHVKFWMPAIEAIVRAILQDCVDSNRGVVFAWWGGESRKTKDSLKACFASFPSAKIEHIDHSNPAAYRDIFCDDPNVFERINKALKTFKLDPIDWLPSAGWQASLAASSSAGPSIADDMGSFIAETQDLHKMYMERLRDGLDISGDELPDITGISELALVSLKTACTQLKLERPAEASTTKAKDMKRGTLTEDEAGAIHLYTTNFLYKMLNDALRSLDRKKVERYFSYLRLLISALDKIPSSSKMLYRGVALDLSAQYCVGTEVTWWAVSSCTPDLKVASSFGGGSKRTLFLINSSRSVGIRDLSQYKNEEEFVLAPGTSFIVEKVVSKGQLHEIHMKELVKQRRVR